MQGFEIDDVTYLCFMQGIDVAMLDSVQQYEWSIERQMRSIIKIGDQ